jgi:hypothetical protein
MPEQQIIFPVLAHFAHTPEANWRANDTSAVETSSVGEQVDINTVASVTPVHHTVDQLEFLATNTSGDTVWVVPPTAQTRIDFKKAAGENGTRTPIYLTTPIPAESSDPTGTPPNPNQTVDIFADKQFLLAAKEAGLIGTPAVPSEADGSKKTGIISRLASFLTSLRR